MLRSLLVATAAAVALASVATGSASAAVLTSQITSPTDPTALPLLVEPAAGPSQQTLTVTGTVTTDDANAADTVELGCFYLSEHGTAADLEVDTLETKPRKPVRLTVHPDGSFTTADLSGQAQASLESLTRETPCRLRAVPVGTAAATDVSAFHGPLIEKDAEVSLDGKDESHLTDDYLQSTTLSGYWGWDSAGSCGPYGKVFDPATQQVDEGYVVNCAASLYETDEAGTAASLVVGEHYAYTVTAAHSIYSGTPAAGQPYLTVSPPSYDPSTGNLSQTESEPLVRCERANGSALDVPHPEAPECAQFASTGVELQRTVETGQSGLQATVTDHYRSTDASSHTLSISYAEDVSGFTSTPSYRFPGESSFSSHATGASLSVGSAAPATIAFQANPAAPEPSNGLQNPRGAITLSSVPSAAKFAGPKYFELIYAGRAVPASGSLTLIHVLSQALTQGELEGLSGMAEERLHAPTVSISSPANASSTTATSTVVSGVVHSNVGLASLTVNGTPVAVAAGGAWTASVPLALGTNTITAAATDTIGQVTNASITVARIAPPQGHAVQIGQAGGAKGKLTLTLACVGAAGTACHLHVSLSTVEKLRGHHLLGLTARARKHSRLVSLASSNVTIQAGSRVKLSISLNAAGRRLLARFGHIPTHLVVVALEGTTRSTVIAQNLTVRRAPHKKHRRRHH